ncbi:MAG: transcription antitermination factor NusB [Nitrosomonas sp.]|nr:transcription antitermination factor NusB [Nitrosomonas sp.]
MQLTEKQVTAHKKTAKYKSKRRIARELVLQGLYQWRLTGEVENTIMAQLRETQVFCRADEAFFSRLLSGVLTHVIQLEQTIQPYLDRPIKELSPVEYGILLLSTYEFIHFLDVPYRAIINEAIELARIYGGSDGYKYVNGVLDKLAYKLRAVETV